MRQRDIFALALTLLLGACTSRFDPAQPIWSVAEKRYIGESEAMARMEDAPFLLLGESHDNPDHHRLQARLVAALAAKGQKRALAFEMIEEDRQPAIDAFLKDHPNQALGLDQAVEWQTRGWPDYALYAPIFQAGLDGGWPILGANLAKSKSKAASQPGGLGNEEEALLGLDLPLPEPIRAELRQNLIDGHCGLLPESALPPMMRLQIAWDGTMASRLADSGQKDGAVLIAGSEHVRKDRAVPYHLARLAPGLNVLAVAFKEQTDPPSPPEAETWPYDLVWFTPPRPEVDHCKDLKERMGKPR
jgi:uncharacterized iron-regulated protein